MARKKKYQKPYQQTLSNGELWFNHYYRYLSSLAFQLFKWEGLPDGVDPRYLEMQLHTTGHVGFFKDPSVGYIVTAGTPSGTINHYGLPTHYHARSPQYQETFKVYNYFDQDPDRKTGVILWNNDMHLPTMDAISLFAADLAENKMITNVNRNAQKTPVLITANDNTRLSLENIYMQYEGNTPVIVANENFDPDSIKVHKTDAPYNVDNLNEHKNSIWNEIMTYLGIKNANQEKKERMITAEADSNDQQIDASANMYLKAREEACEQINRLHPDLNVSVSFRNEVVNEITQNAGEDPEDEKGGDMNE